MAEWVPDPNGIAQVLELARLAQTPGKHQETRECLTEYNQISDFNKYLCHVFTLLTSEADGDRMMVGLVLKDNVARHWKTMTPEVQHYIMELAPAALQDPSLALREVCGSLISVILAQTTIAGWPHLVDNLIACLHDENTNLVQGALTSLSLLCEDHGRALSTPQSNVTQQPTDLLIPKLYEILQSNKPEMVDAALKCISHLIPWQPVALHLSINDFFAILFALAENPLSPAVLVTVCKTFDALVSGRVAAIVDHMPSVVQYMLTMTASDLPQVALAASNFWSTIADSDTHICYEALQPHLTDVVRTLLRYMRYSEEDLEQLVMDVNEDILEPDRPEATNPAAGKQMMGGDAQGSYDTSIEVSGHTLRKACGHGLEDLSGVFSEDLLEVMIPMCLEGLQSEDWLDREACIFALGVTSQTFIDVGEEHLGGLVPMLLELLDTDPRALIRRITAWSVSRFATWIAKHPDVLHSTVETLHRRLADRSKHVLEWVFQTLAILAEAAEEKMRDYFEGLLQTYMHLFSTLGGICFNKLLDALGALSESVAGEALNQSHILELLMPPLMDRWEQLAMVDYASEERLAAALYDCVTRVAIALGVSFSPWAPVVWDRCTTVLQEHLMALALYKQSPETIDPPSTKVFVSAIELINALISGLKAGAADLISESNLIPILVEILSDTATPVVRCTLGLIGDLAVNCYAQLEPALEPVLAVVIANVRPRYHTSIPINASWALKEIVDRAGENMTPYIADIINRSVGLMHDPNQHEQLHQNCAILISSVANHFPQVVAANLHNFIGPWCMLLASLQEDEDKKSSFFGLLSAIQHNPEAVLPEFSRFAFAVASWGAPSNSLRQAFIDIFAAYQQQLGPEVWDTLLKTVNEEDLVVLEQWYL